MFDVDFQDLDLGSRKAPTEWVAVAPALKSRQEQKRERELPLRQRGKDRKAAQAASAQPGSGGKSKAAARAVDPDLIQKLKEKCEGNDPTLPWLPAEEETGNVEYKLRIKDPSPSRFQQLITQMKYRLSEGNNECFYYLGVEDGGYLRGLRAGELESSLQTLNSMATKLRAAATLLQVFRGARQRRCALVHVRRSPVAELSFADLRVAVAGAVDCGKSTLVAVLTHGVDGSPLLDNGRGSVRTSVLQHKHEIVSGRTSSISPQIAGYDCKGSVLNYMGVAPLTPAEIADAAVLAVHFLDLGGHEKYLKTALHGMTCMLPDFVMLCVSATTGPNLITLEHLAASLALRLPVFVVLTKCDAADRATLQSAVTALRSLAVAVVSTLSSGTDQEQMDPEAVAPLVESKDEAAQLAAQLGSFCRSKAGLEQQNMLPILSCSSVKGTGIPVVHAFLRGLGPSAPSLLAQAEPQQDVDAGEAPAALFQVDNSFRVRSIGSVVSGTILQGDIGVGQELWLGPSGELAAHADSCWMPVEVRSMQRLRVPVLQARAGQAVTLALMPKSYAGTAPSPLPAASPPDCPSLFAGGCPEGRSCLAWPADPQLPCGHARARTLDDEAGEAALRPAACAVHTGSPRSPAGSAQPSLVEQLHLLAPEPSQPPDSPAMPGPSPVLVTGGSGMSLDSSLSVLRMRMPSVGTDMAAACDGTAWLDTPAPSFDMPAPSLPPSASALMLSAMASSPLGFSSRAAPGYGVEPCIDRCAAEKGMLLATSSLRPPVAREFDALLVFLHWPSSSPRCCDVFDDAAATTGSGTESGCDSRCGTPGVAPPTGIPFAPGSPRTRSSRRMHRSLSPQFRPVVHSYNVRQAAQIVHIQVLSQVETGHSIDGHVFDLRPALAAAAVHGGTKPVMDAYNCVGYASPISEPSSLEKTSETLVDSSNSGQFVARVTLQFVHHVECMSAGMRLVLRDPSRGRLAAAGIVCSVGA